MPKKKFSLLGFLFESESAFYIIAANFFMFGFVRSQTGQAYLPSLVLYPANLMDGNYFSIITSGFIHRDLLHLLANMLGVFVFARIVERHLGVLKTFFVYFGALTISMLFSLVIYKYVHDLNVGIIGASGALMGLIAASMLLDPFCITYEMIIPLPVIAKGWMFLYADIQGLLNKESTGVSHYAHIFGFFSIAILVYFLSKKDKKQMRAGLITNIASVIIFILAKSWISLPQEQ